MILNSVAISFDEGNNCISLCPSVGIIRIISHSQVQEAANEPKDIALNNHAQKGPIEQLTLHLS